MLTEATMLEHNLNLMYEAKDLCAISTYSVDGGSAWHLRRSSGLTLLTSGG